MKTAPGARVELNARSPVVFADANGNATLVVRHDDLVDLGGATVSATVPRRLALSNQCGWAKVDVEPTLKSVHGHWVCIGDSLCEVFVENGSVRAKGTNGTIVRIAGATVNVTYETTYIELDPIAVVTEVGLDHMAAVDAPAPLAFEVTTVSGTKLKGTLELPQREIHNALAQRLRAVERRPIASMRDVEDAKRLRRGSLIVAEGVQTDSFSVLPARKRRHPRRRGAGRPRAPSEVDARLWQVRRLGRFAAFPHARPP